LENTKSILHDQQMKIILIFLKNQVGLHICWRCWFVDIAKWNILINIGYHQNVVHHKILHLWHCSKMFYNICVLHHPNHFLTFDIHVCELQPPNFWVQDLQNYKQLMPVVRSKRIDNYKIFNNAQKFHYQHCISMYKFILLYLGAIFQFTHDLSHKFIIDLLVICHFHLLTTLIYLKNVTTMFW